MNQVIRTIIGVIILLALAYVVWKFKWVILITAVVGGTLLVLSNTLYKRLAGQDMAFYARMMKRTK